MVKPSRGRYVRANALTTFTNEQATYLAVGGTGLLVLFGWMMYQAGKMSQQIEDLQAGPVGG